MSLDDYDMVQQRRPPPPQSVKGVCYLLAVLALVFGALPGYVLYVCASEGSLQRDAVTFGFTGGLLIVIAWCLATSVLLWRGSRFGLKMFFVLRLLLSVKPKFARMLEAELRKPDAIRYFEEANA